MNKPLVTGMLLFAAWTTGTGLLLADAATVAAPQTPTAEIEKVVEDDHWKPGDPMKVGIFTFDAEWRERLEYRANWIDFNNALDTRDDLALLQRIRLGLKIAPADWLTFYVQGQDSRTFFDDSAGPVTNREFIENDDPYALRQAYVQLDKLFGQDLMLKVGRQVLSYGNQRLIGGFEWDNNARTFDAVRTSYKTGDLTIDYFAGYVVVHNTSQFDEPDSEDLFTGVYGTYDGLEKFSFDGYFLYRSKSDVDANTIWTNGSQSSGNTAPPGDYFTLGTLWETRKDSFGPWDANTEMAVQFGEISNPTGFGPVVAGNPINTSRQDLLAFAAHLEGGYTFKSLYGTPRAAVEYNFSTGDSNPNNGTSNTFQNLFPTNHYYYGYMDRFSWQNMHDVAFKADWQPLKNLSVKAAYHLFWLANTNDVWRFAGQGPVGGAPRYGNALNSNPSSFVGSELDIMARWAVTKWFNVEGGYSHFFVGNYINDTGTVPGGDDADFLYLQTRLNF